MKGGEEKNMKSLGTVAWWLVVIGALNWGAVGLLKINLVEAILGSIVPGLVNIVYILVGLSGVYVLFNSLGKK